MIHLTRFVSWPWALALVVALPVATWWMVERARRIRAQRLAHLGSEQMVARLTPGAVRGSRARSTRLALAVFFAAIAFAGPRWGLERTVVKSAGIDVVLALDASSSMLARDEAPSRLDKMKDVVDRLRELSPGDRFALVAFAGRSYVLSPMTVDDAALNLYIGALDPTIVGQAGSSLASAVRQATNLLSISKSEAERAIVLMSDGEGFEGEDEVIQEAKRAEDLGITLITVGFGTPEGATIPIVQNGTVTQKRDAAGAVVITRYHPEMLRAAAEAARGRFIEPTNPDRAAAVRQVLATLRTQQRSITSGSNFGQRFQLFLIPAFLLLVIDTFLASRQPRKRSVSPAATTAAAATLFLGGCGYFSTDRASIELYNRGTHMLSRPDSVVEAIPLFHKAAESKDPEVRYRAGFNEGFVHLNAGLSAKGDSATTPLDSALAVYKRVLLGRSDDGDAKWNYELALRRKKSGGGGGGGGGGGAAPRPQPQPSQSPEQAPSPRAVPGMNAQRAEQILNAMEQEEQDVQGRKQRRNVPQPPPSGKDW